MPNVIKKPDLTRPPGLVGEISKLANDLNYREQPDLAVLGGLVTVATASLNGWYTARTRTTLNHFLMGVAASGEGKEAPRNATKLCLAKIGLKDTMNEEIGSGPAVLQALLDAPDHVCVLLVDEIGEFMLGAKHPGSNNREVMTTLMRLYGLADKTYTGRKLRSNAIPSIENPFMSVLGMTTNGNLVEALTDAHVRNGYLNRFLIFIVDTPGAALKVPSAWELPDAIAIQLKRITQHSNDARLREMGERLMVAAPAEGTLFVGTERERAQAAQERAQALRRRKMMGPAFPLSILWQADAYAAYLAFAQKCSDRRVALDPDGIGSLWVRTAEHAVKVAATLALGVAAQATVFPTVVIDMDLWIWAETYVARSARRMQALAETEVADTPFGRDTKRVLKWIDEKGVVTLSEFTRRWQDFEPGHREKLLESLQGATRIHLKSLMSKGAKTSTTYIHSLRTEAKTSTISG